MKKALVLLATLVALSCEKEIEYEIPNPGDKIVIGGNLEEGKPVAIYLSKSVYSMSNDYPVTNNTFTAKLYTDDPASPFTLQAVQVNTYEPKYEYQSNHVIESGKAYRLEVSAADLPTAQVNTSVPKNAVVQNLVYNSTTKDIEFEIKDEGKEENFYMITLSDDANNSVYLSSLDLELEFLEFDIFIGDDDYDGRRYGDRAYIADQKWDGNSRKFNIRIEIEPMFNRFYLNVYSISKSYYRHEITKAAYYNSDGFFSEPVQLHSNVEGGYGILGAAAKNSTLIQY